MSNEVRYIKLGERGSWEEECLRDGTIRFGFNTSSDERFALCMDSDWPGLQDSFVASGRTKGIAKNFTNQARAFFEDRGHTLWITFFQDKMWWARLDKGKAQRHPDKGGVFRIVKGSWRCTDRKGEELAVSRLRGDLTQLRAFRGTSCKVDLNEYVIARIRGEKSQEVERAVKAFELAKKHALTLARQLHPKDFEILVDLIFSRSGWHRMALIGGVQPTLDLSIILPTSGERAFVQVKSKTTMAEFNKYAKKLDEPLPYSKMFYVFHTGKIESDDERIVVIGPDRLADLIINAGLLNWLIEKRS